MIDDRELLARLSETVEQVVGFYESIGDFDVLVNSTWTARDVLVHVVFWHESFARNVDALAKGVKPSPLKGTYAQLSERASLESEGQTVGELLERLTGAQRTIERSILDPRIISIPYKVGSRPYTPSEHLGVVNEHVSGHLGKVRLAYSSQESRST